MSFTGSINNAVTCVGADLLGLPSSVVVADQQTVKVVVALERLRLAVRIQETRLCAWTTVRATSIATAVLGANLVISALHLIAPMVVRTAVLDLVVVAAKRISGAHLGAIVDEREAADTIEEEVVGHTVLGLTALFARLPSAIVATQLERVGVAAMRTG
jgi:hypothetical protein